MQEHLDRQPELTRVHRRTVEHPFGTMKCWMGWAHFPIHFLTKTQARVRIVWNLASRPLVDVGQVVR